uniref:apolipoprotein N-acyltransferase n=1 Tax=Candidatus Electronema sp. TaxID=2698783 RepID=UPI0040559DEE
MSDENVPNRLLTLAAPAASALLLSLAMPGLTGWWPLLFVALIPLLWAARRLPPAQSGGMGMFSGLLYHLGLFYWISGVMERYGGLHSAAALAVLVLLAAYMAAYTAVFCAIFNRLTGRPNSGRALSVTVLLTAPAAWVGLDVARGWLFTGLPWMDLGYGLSSQPLLIQAADLGGHHLITFFIVQINALLLWILEQLFRRPTVKTAKREYLLAVMVCLCLYSAGGYSTFRYRQVAFEAAEAEQAAAAAAQGNIEQSVKWSPAQKTTTVERYIALTEQLLSQGMKPDLVVWPETALPFYPHRDPLMGRVRDFVDKNKIQLITGAPFFTVEMDAPDSGEKKNLKPVEYFNSAILLDRSGKMVDRYSKQHLVPFGEYVPLREYLWFVRPLVELLGDFTPGSSSEPLAADRIRAGTLICFESIFPEIARKTTADGANLLINLTNDAWYGRTSAPHHSWAMTVMRAVENRRSLLRAANTGISGIIEPTGAVKSQSGLFHEAVLADNSIALLTGQTFFVRIGHWFGSCCLALTGLLLLGRWQLDIGRRKQARSGGGGQL